MAYLLIDGYNLIGTAHRKLEEARNDLVQKLCKYSKIKAHNITLVFDGWKNGQGIETKIRSGGIDIIYSRIGEKADNVIMRILSKEKRAWIVISSDREIADFADSKNLVPVTSDEFEKRLYSTLKTTGKDITEEFSEYDDDEDTDFSPARIKGNPRKLSKKQKMKLRALKKL